MELVYLSKPAVDELFREIVPLHQEHVDLGGKAEALQLCGRAGPHTPLRLNPPGNPPDLSVTAKLVFYIHHPNKRELGGE